MSAVLQNTLGYELPCSLPRSNALLAETFVHLAANLFTRLKPLREFTGRIGDHDISFPPEHPAEVQLILERLNEETQFRELKLWNSGNLV